jgi:ADP-ribosyl-[dinitrogen reductase] hydrolase
VRILCVVLCGADLRETILAQAGDWISALQVTQWSREPDDIVVGERLSAACYVPNAFKASLYLAWKYADNFEAGVIANTNAGGENCHRGVVIGALLGSAAGIDRLPPRFVEGIEDGPALSARIGALVAAAPD